MDLSLDKLRLEAKLLQRAWIAREAVAVERLHRHPPRLDMTTLKRADFLYVIALENGFESWPRLKWAAETVGLDKAGRLQRLKIALFNNRPQLAKALLDEHPDLAEGHFGLQVALYDRGAVAKALAEDPTQAVEARGPRRPIVHLAFSCWLKARPELEQDMLAIAEMLVRHGADVNDGQPVAPGNDHVLSVLYGAIGHSNNMALGQWLLDQGADPNDNESLYHATELGHHAGLKMLLAAGADPTGTNALLRALDFNDHVAVQMLLDHGARADDFNDAEVGGESPWVVPALHQAARRNCDAQMVELLLKAGADPQRRYKGASAYGYARVHGNHAVFRAIEAHQGKSALTAEETRLAAAAEGLDQPGQYIDPAQLPEAYATLLHELVGQEGCLDHVTRLVELGLPWDAPDGQGLPPVQLAGWEGRPEMMAYFLKLGPDLSHVNSYGGTLLGSILHGAENNPDRDNRDHMTCLELALHEGVALPRADIGMIGREDIRAFLEDWAEARPGQVI